MTRFRQGKVECRTFIHRALGPNSAPVAVNDSLHRGQTYARSWVLIAVMKTLKGAKKPVRVGWVETCAVVSNVVGVPSIRILPAKLDASGLTLRRKFPSVAEQVFQCDSDQVGID